MVFSTTAALPVTNKNYWEPKLLRNVARDGIADAALMTAGWTVIRAWEHEDAAEVADRVEAAVRPHAFRP